MLTSFHMHLDTSYSGIRESFPLSDYACSTHPFSFCAYMCRVAPSAITRACYLTSLCLHSFFPPSSATVACLNTTLSLHSDTIMLHNKAIEEPLSVTDRTALSDIEV